MATKPKSSKHSTGERIRSLRIARSMTQHALAKAVGITQGSLTQLERGVSKAPAAETLVRLSRLFNVSPNWIISGEGAASPDDALPPDELELLNLFRRLSPEGRRYVVERSRHLLSSEDLEP
jgi:transcriptional regulator with XRE-family HTH domain